jgi:hypothetical protein
VDEGIWEAHVSRFPSAKKGKKEPEFAILRLSADRYKEFQKDAVGFVNKHGVFGVPANRPSVMTPPPPQVEDPQPDVYYVIVPHWPGSTIAATAYAGGSAPK